MFNSNVFDYVNVLNKASDAAWLRNEVISHNIANVSTPNYKRQDVAFEETFRRAMSESRYISTDQKISDLNLRALSPKTYTDYSGFSYRKDGNNVDIDTENARLASNQIKYNALIDSTNQEFMRLNLVMK